MNDMSSEEFRRAGRELVDWIAGYLENIRDYPVLPRVSPGFMHDQLPSAAPENGEPIDDILRDFRDQIVPGITHWNHPRFHAFFSVSASAPGILAEFATAALNVNGMLWKSSPSAVELEQICLAWLRQWLGLPDDFFGIIYDTASVSTMHALAAARDCVDPEARTRGSLPNLTIYTSEHAHSSVEKGAIAIGMGQSNVRKIPSDSEFRIKIDALRAAIDVDLKAGKKPCCIVPTIGTTSTTSIDSVPQTAAIAKECGAWLHVDGAYGGTAAILPELRHLMEGVDQADSFVVNPHKWLFTPIDLSAFYTRRPDILRRAFSLVPEYLRTADDPRAMNYMDYGVPLGRRFRALKLWFVMRYFGREGVTAILRNHIAWTQELASWIAADPRFEISAPSPFALVCFRYKGTDEENRVLLDRINASGKAFLSHTVLNGRYVLRLSIGNVKTTHADVESTWEAIQASA